MATTTSDMIVFFSYKKHKKGYYKMLFSRLASAAQSQGITLYQGSLKDLHVSFVDDKMHIYDPVNDRALDTYDMVYFELWSKAPQQALAAAKYLEKRNIPYLGPEVGKILADSKLGEYALLTGYGLPLIESYTSSNPELKKLFASNAPLEYPFVLKSISAFGGTNNFLIDSYEKLTDILDNYKEETFIAQKFIPNDCDYRLLIFGDEVKLVLKRTRVDQNSHLNNTTVGAEGEFVPVSTLSDEMIADSIKAARLVGRGEFCGLDLVVDKDTGQHYILEINQAPGIELGFEPEIKMKTLLVYLQGKAKGNRNER